MLQQRFLRPCRLNVHSPWLPCTFAVTPTGEVVFTVDKVPAVPLYYRGLLVQLWRDSSSVPECEAQEEERRRAERAKRFAPRQKASFEAIPTC